jgi:hypothetical protein
MNHPVRLAMTAEQYPAWEKRPERTHELVDGAEAELTLLHLDIALPMAELYDNVTFPDDAD